MHCGSGIVEGKFVKDLSAFYNPQYVLQKGNCGREIYKFKMHLPQSTIHNSQCGRGVMEGPCKRSIEEAIVFAEDLLWRIDKVNIMESE